MRTHSILHIILLLRFCITTIYNIDSDFDFFLSMYCNVLLFIYVWFFIRFEIPRFYWIGFGAKILLGLHSAHAHLCIQIETQFTFWNDDAAANFLSQLQPNMKCGQKIGLWRTPTRRVCVCVQSVVQSHSFSRECFLPFCLWFCLSVFLIFSNTTGTHSKRMCTPSSTYRFLNEAIEIFRYNGRTKCIHIFWIELTEAMHECFSAHILSS